MKRRMTYVAAVLLAATSAKAQDKPAVVSETPLRLQVVMTRFEGEKKVGSLPYTFLVNAAEAGTPPVSKVIAMGVQVPITVMVRDAPTVAFKDVGSKVVCSATSLGGGRYRLHLEVEQSTVADQGSRSPGSAISGPVLRQFKDSVDVVMRDGQTTQTSSAADPVSGEVIKIDVTLTVVK